MKKVIAVLSLLVSVATGTASASPIGVFYDSFGPFPTANFGGSGIPTDWVAVSTYTDGANDITIALSATQRFTNPALTNDGAGTFSAEAGQDVLSTPGPACPAVSNCAKWNFDFYVSSTGGSYTYDLLYDFDPAFNTDQADLGQVRIVTAGTGQNSWNLGFNFLEVTAGAVTRPSFLGPFDPGAFGQYSFGIILRDSTTLAELDRVAIEVSTVPEPASLLLLGAGLSGLVARARRKRQAKSTSN